MDDNPILIHMHIPKCAGQWLDAVLQRVLERTGRARLCNFGAAANVLYLEDPRFKGKVEVFAEEIQKRRGVRVISSQKFMHEFPETLGGRPVQYTCMLREPGEQLLSFLRYSIAGYGSFQEGFQTKLPEGLGDMSLKDAAIKLINERPGLVTHFLPIRHLSATQDQAEAFENLDKIHFVGTVDRSEELVSRLCHWFDPALCVESVLPEGRVNASPDERNENGEVRELAEFAEYLEWEPVKISRLLWERVRDRQGSVSVESVESVGSVEPRAC